ncbi:MAG: hypothetical protein Q9204_002320, partial [Flavoplaca sp. TL-2023a]
RPTPRPFSLCFARVNGSRFYTAAQAIRLEQLSDDYHATPPSQFGNTTADTLSPTLPLSCPGCGARTVGLGTQEQAGYYNLGRKSVKLFITQAKYLPRDSAFTEFKTFDTAVRQAGDVVQSQLGLEKGLNPTTARQVIEESDECMSEVLRPIPSCNRCHHLLHHSSASPIVNPTIQSIQQMIGESPYSYNHIYHVLDAADFPLSFIPQLQRRLDLMPQRSHNRRAKTRVFRQGRRAEISFIITRSDLLAPQKSQVDALMPYLVQVLRDALGPSGKNVRLGNVRCVSSRRGWWTRQVKDEISSRGGGGWMVGKVNVGKSSLFESVFPKGAPEGTVTVSGESNGKSVRTPYQHAANQVLSVSGAEAGSLLPPAQPWQQFPSMPTVSHYPGTTASPIRVPFGNGRGELIDLPGLSRGSLEDHVVAKHRPDLVMRQRVKPEQLVIKPGQSLLISGLVRITPTTPDVTFLAYPFVPLASHVTSTDKAIAMSTQTQPSGVPTVAKPGVGPKMALARVFRLEWDVTKQRTGPLTSAATAGLSSRALPFVVFSTDILIEGCGWVELVAQLYSVRLGIGAAVLPRNVKRIHLDFAFKLNDGHFGARKVWRNYLPRLKYHNPAVSMSVNRTQNQTGPATLTVFFAAPSHSASNASATAPLPSVITQDTHTPGHTSFERTVTIEMKHRHESEILSELLSLTKASPVEPLPEDKAELEKLAEEERQAGLDRARNAAYTEQKRQDKALLDQARGAAGAS